MTTNTSTDNLEKALKKVNKLYGDNIKFNRFDKVGNKNRFTLKVNSTKDNKKGYKIGYSGRKVASACWHVHGDFFDALIEVDSNAVIKSLDKTIDKDGGNWQDFNVGSIVQPLYASEACTCNE